MSKGYSLIAICLAVAVFLTLGCADALPPDLEETGLAQQEAEPDPPNGDDGPSGSAPVPISPIEGALISQNDSTIGCAYHPQRGYGLQIVFAWSAVTGDTVAGYEVFAKKRTAIYPIIDHWTVVSPELPYTSCNSFVIDRNLDGWEWKVRVVTDSTGRGPWSATAEFAFEPCRHSDGTACSAPPESD